MPQLQVNASGLLKSCPTETQSTAVVAGCFDQFWGPIPSDMLSVPSSKPQVSFCCTCTWLIVSIAYQIT